MVWVHIVGCPRSGTTLALESFAHGFEAAGFAANERPIAHVLGTVPHTPGVYFSKQPGDVVMARYHLALEPKLWFVYLLRDPRDVVVSRHRLVPERYWTNLRIWRRYDRAARRLSRHRRFVTLRYEDLVRSPREAQNELVRAMPFLNVTAAFDDVHRLASPSEQHDRSLGGLRPITASRIGNWRHHKPRVVGQMARHGSLVPDLIERGYESDAAWIAELAGVAPDLEPSFHSERPIGLRQLRLTLTRWRGVADCAWRAVRRRS